MVFLLRLQTPLSAHDRHVAMSWLARMFASAKWLAVATALLAGPACIACSGNHADDDVSAGALVVSSRVTEDLSPVLGLDGVRVTETGTLRGGQVQGRRRWPWRDACLQLQLQLARVTGQTQYNGYDQGPLALTPLHAITGNDFNSRALEASLLSPVLPASRLDAGVKVTWMQSGWLRSLVDYTERYDATTVSLGLQFAGRMTKEWSFDIGIERGVGGRTRLSVPARTVRLWLPQPSFTRSVIGVDVAVGTELTLRLDLTASRRSTSASDLAGPFIQPPMTLAQRALGIGLTYKI